MMGFVLHYIVDIFLNASRLCQNTEFLNCYSNIASDSTKSVS